MCSQQLQKIYREKKVTDSICRRGGKQFCHSASFRATLFRTGQPGVWVIFAVPTCLGPKKWQQNNKLRSSKRKANFPLWPQQLLAIFVLFFFFLQVLVLVLVSRACKKAQMVSESIVEGPIDGKTFSVIDRSVISIRQSVFY